MTDSHYTPVPAPSISRIWHCIDPDLRALAEQKRFDEMTPEHVEKAWHEAWLAAFEQIIDQNADEIRERARRAVRERYDGFGNAIVDLVGLGEESDLALLETLLDDDEVIAYGNDETHDVDFGRPRPAMAIVLGLFDLLNRAVEPMPGKHYHHFVLRVRVGELAGWAVKRLRARLSG
jgi:hypothetical protein